MKKVFVFLLAASSVAVISSCSKSSTTPSTTANVMFVNGCAGTSALGLSVNGTVLANAAAITYLKGSGYQTFTAGNDTFKVLVSSIGQALVDMSAQTTVGGNYSLFAAGLVTGSSFIFSTDDLTAPASGNAKIRLVNACADTNKLSGNATTGSAGAIAFASNLSSSSISAFSQVAAGSYKLVVLQPSNAISAVDTSNVQFNAGKIYTVMFSGNASGGYRLTILNNN